MTEPPPQLASWSLDLSTGNAHWSPQLYRLLDLPRDVAPTADRWFEFIHPEDRPRVSAELQAALNSAREAFTAEFRIVVGNRVRWLLSEAAIVRAGDGTPTALFGINVDLTDRRRIEDELRESERQFETLANGSPVLLWVNGPDGCEFVNEAYQRFLGVTVEDVRGNDWSRYVHPDDRDGYLKAYLEASEARGAFDAEFRFRRADGEWRWMRSQATPRMVGGAFRGYVGATTDITDRKLAEEALRESDQRKNEFLATLAHELRNPLAPLRTGLELLRISGDKIAALARIRPMMERQVAHMVRLIDGLLDVARITSGRVQLQRRAAELSELVQMAIDAQRPLLDASKLELVVQLPPAPCTIHVDPTRIVQVVSNVLHNAAKFTDAGGRVTLTAVAHPDASPPAVTITIRDTGVGIAPDVLPKIFDLFAQGAQTDRSKSGLGIGLALTKQLVELHDGSIDVESGGDGKGTCFAIRLPVLMVDCSAHEDPAAARTASTTRRVLIIDDNVDAAETLAMLVTALGGEAETAHRGEVGIRVAADFHPDIILLDIGMPGIDGYETCRRLRQASFAEAARIIAITGWGQEHDRERARQAGFDSHLTKPADPEALRALLTDQRQAN